MRKGPQKELDISGNTHIEDMWRFIDEKLADEGQSMNIEVLYKNFMGIGNTWNSKDYGLTRRMVQIFLLCLVQEGKIRLGIGPKSGLPAQSIDYSNIAEIDFSARIMDSLTEVQKMARPENWEILRPYAEKILQRPVPATADDAEITQLRADLRKLFTEEKESSARLENRAKSLFEFLRVSNPYETEVSQFVKLFSTDLEGGNDINLVLYGLKEAFGYQAFDEEKSSESEIDDLSNRLANYKALQQFVDYDRELRTAHEYCAQALPDIEDLAEVRKEQQQLSEKMASLQPYIDSEVKLRTELIGRIPAEGGEKGTVGSLIREYTLVYLILHESIVSHSDSCRQQIQDMLSGDDLKALRVMGEITALQSGSADILMKQLGELADNVFACSSPSRGSVEEHLKENPIHECGLIFEDASDVRERSTNATEKAQSQFDQTLDGNISILMTPAIIQRLEQGRDDPVIAGILKCKTLSELRAYLVRTCLEENTAVGTINRYLKRISVKPVKLTDFKPSLNAIEKEQIPQLAQEFHQFLEEQMHSIEADDETLPILQIE